MAVFTRNFTKTVLPKKLHEELDAIVGPIFEGVTTKGDSLTVVLSQEPTTAQDQDILDTVNDHDPTPDAIQLEEELTKNRQLDGEKLYQKMYADLSLNATFATVDSSIVGYDTLTKLRCMLKDGSGKTALRYLVTDLVINDAQNPLFPADQRERFRQCIRDYCFKYRAGDGDDPQGNPYSAYDRAAYDLFLNYIETAQNV